jgi:hypothetical protein
MGGDTGAGGEMKDMHQSPYKLALFHRVYELENTDGITMDEAAMIANDPTYWSIPVYGYDHSGFWISPDIEFYWWHYAWDGGQLGIAYAKKGQRGVPRKKEKAIEALRKLVYSLQEQNDEK